MALSVGSATRRKTLDTRLPGAINGFGHKAINGFGDKRVRRQKEPGMVNGKDDEPASGPDAAEQGEDDIPLAPLRAMQTRMHSHLRPEPGEVGRIRRRLGSDDDALYITDDGPDHCMVGRRVGHAPDGCTYCLVARISLDQYEELVEGDIDPTQAFSDARDISLCGVFGDEQAVSNVLLVEHYTRPGDVPDEYLPPSPFVEFTDDAPEG
jgi:hypothetical protein